MSREEIQISDLEPSVIGEDVTRYAIQIRGVDGNGNEGPWSTILEYESPELLPSLQSDNYVENESGWFLDNDGTFEVNDGFIRGTLQSSNYVPNSSGWALDVDGNVEFSSGTFRGALKIGQNTFNVDPGGNLFIGGSNINNSPFAVDTSGQIVAMSINASFIQANTITAGKIAANTITANQIAANTITANQIAANTITANQIAANTITANQIATNYVYAGSISADQITAGTMSANRISGGSLSGLSVSAINLTASGEFNVQSGRLRVDLGGGVVSNTSIAASSHITTNSDDGFRLGATTSDPKYRRDGNDAEIYITGNPGTSSNSLRVTTLNTSSFGVNVQWLNSTGRFFAPGSSRSIKKNIMPTGKIPGLLEIEPVTFLPKHPVEVMGGNESDIDKESKDYFPEYEIRQVGVIAEQLDEIGLDLFVAYRDGAPAHVYYDKIGAALIPYIKELYDRIEQLEEQLNGS